MRNLFWQSRGHNPAQQMHKFTLAESFDTRQQKPWKKITKSVSATFLNLQNPPPKIYLSACWSGFPLFVSFGQCCKKINKSPEDHDVKSLERSALRIWSFMLLSDAAAGSPNSANNFLVLHLLSWFCSYCEALFPPALPWWLVPATWPSLWGCSIVQKECCLCLWGGDQSIQQIFFFAFSITPPLFVHMLLSWIHE